VIEKVGHVNREVDTDLFSSVVHHIIGQQISMKAQATIWQRMRQELGTVCAESILEAGIPKLQSYGMTFRKAEYLTDFAQAVGGAVGHNPISLIVPCHRVVGTDGSMTGYAGGIDKKGKLLKLEQGAGSRQKCRSNGMQ